MKKVGCKICNYVTACVPRLPAMFIHIADSLLPTWQLREDPDCSISDYTCHNASSSFCSSEFVYTEA